MKSNIKLFNGRFTTGLEYLEMEKFATQGMREMKHKNSKDKSVL